MPDHEEFMRLFVQNEPQLRVLVASLVRDRHERDDVLQELTLVLWREFDRYDRARPFSPWARGVAGKLILRRWREEGRSLVRFSPEAIVAIVDSFDRREGSVSDRQIALEHCLEKLPARSRQMISLRYEHELKLQQIADRTAGKLQAVHKLLARSRDRLLECIENRLAASEAPK